MATNADSGGARMRSMTGFHVWPRHIFVVLSLLLWCKPASCALFDIVDDYEAIPNERSRQVIRHNTDAFQKAFRNLSSNVLRIPANQTFHLYHGLFAKQVHDAVIEINGKLAFERDFSETPWLDNLDAQKRHPRPFIFFMECDNITLTSKSHRGVIDGQGPQWWGFPFIGYMQLQEFRPTTMQFNMSTNLLIEKLIFKDAPLYNLYLTGVNGVEIRHSSVVARRTHEDGHGIFDLSAFNTDGIDIAGHNVWIHDVDIWNQDDCIAVKDNYHDGGVSSNMTFERINASGLGFTIGSIGGSTVRNITFKDSYLHKSYKGIYLKFRDWSRDARHHRPGLIEDILFENITIESPLQWGVWIGPAQQAIDNNPCHAAPCSLCWPLIPFSQCHAVQGSKFRNITLRNIVINNPKASPGVLLGDDDTRIEGLVFEDVVVTQGPPLTSKDDRYIIFPGLRQRIDDPGMRQAVYLIFVLGFLLVTLILCCIQTPVWLERKCLYTGVAEDNDSTSTPFQREQAIENESPHFDDLSTITDMQLGEATICGCCLPRKNNAAHLKRRHRILIVAFVAVFAVLCGWLLTTSYQMRNVTQYFACSGIEGGIARGSTWPVPSCFHDETKPMIGELTFGMSLAEKCFLVLGIVCLAIFFRNSSALLDEAVAPREDQSLPSSFDRRPLLPHDVPMIPEAGEEEDASSEILAG